MGDRAIPQPCCAARGQAALDAFVARLIETALWVSFARSQRAVVGTTTARQARARRAGNLAVKPVIEDGTIMVAVVTECGSAMGERASALRAASVALIRRAAQGKP